MNSESIKSIKNSRNQIKMKGRVMIHKHSSFHTRARISWKDNQLEWFFLNARWKEMTRFFHRKPPKYPFWRLCLWFNASIESFWRRKLSQELEDDQSMRKIFEDYKRWKEKFVKEVLECMNDWIEILHLFVKALGIPFNYTKIFASVGEYL
jgi:hypothetical protein